MAPTLKAPCPRDLTERTRGCPTPGGSEIPRYLVVNGLDLPDGSRHEPGDLLDELPKGQIQMLNDLGAVATLPASSSKAKATREATALSEFVANAWDQAKEEATGTDLAPEQVLREKIAALNALGALSDAEGVEGDLADLADLDPGLDSGFAESQPSSSPQKEE